VTITSRRPAAPAVPTSRWALAPADLLRVAEGLAHSADTWPGLDDPVERCWRMVALTERFEAWVVAWPVGGAIELHDHGRSDGVVVVAAGRLVETSLRLDADGGPAARSIPVASGDHVLFGPGHVHDLVNEGPGRALSVHVYTPALRTMTFFDRSTSGLVPVRTEHYHDGVLVG
jgi:mannose-6-phosphate isomerase-like protein (cupin superfamily)